jgi:hypothetical protein
LIKIALAAPRKVDNIMANNGISNNGAPNSASYIRSLSRYGIESINGVQLVDLENSLKEMQKKLTPRLIRTFFLSLVRAYFTDHEEYPWVQDKSKTEIFIQGDYAPDVRKEDIVPSIIVQGTGFTFVKDAISGQRMSMATKDNLGRTWGLQHTIVGGIAINCIAHTSIDAEELAFSLSLLLSATLLYVKEVLSLQNIDAPQVSPASVLSSEGVNSTYISTINIGYKFAIGQLIDESITGPLIGNVVFLTAEQMNEIAQKRRGIKDADLIPGDNDNGGNTGGNDDDDDDGIPPDEAEKPTKELSTVDINIIVRKDEV